MDLFFEIERVTADCPERQIEHLAAVLDRYSCDPRFSREERDALAAWSRPLSAVARRGIAAEEIEVEPFEGRVWDAVEALDAAWRAASDVRAAIAVWTEGVDPALVAVLRGAVDAPLGTLDDAITSARDALVWRWSQPDPVVVSVEARARTDAA